MVVSMRPNSQTYAPDPAGGDGQYLIVTKGSLLHNRKEYRTWSLIFTGAKDDPFRVNAGSTGLEAIVLNFPLPRARRIATVQRAPIGFRLGSALCGFVYHEAAGLPEEGIAPGTRWQDVPETWNCPDCSATKADFQMIQV